MEKSTKKLIVAGVVVVGIAIAWKNWNKWFPKTTTPADSASGINGAQFLYEQGALKGQGQSLCNCRNNEGGFTQQPCPCGAPSKTFPK